MIKNFTISDEFFGRYEKLVKEVVIPYQESALNDKIEGAEKSHAVENFRLCAKKLETGSCDDEFYGMVFQDSDIAKWLEGTAYSLLMFPDKELEKRCDEMIDLIEKAQHPDGYLNTYFTVKEPNRRWTNLQEAHELYCAGHMMEASVAYAECTGKTKLLDIMSRMTDNIYEHFITEGAEGYSGHPEVELALMRMYRCTNDEKYLTLAKHFVDVRGVDPYYFKKESERRGWTVWGSNPDWLEYTQSDVPARKLTKATGHAVRAVYLYTAMADLAKEVDDAELKSACKSLWDNITKCKMYVTGAIGSAYEGEAFTKDYHLPNDTAYAETCASIGLIFFANKMLAVEKNSRYADTMERALYNCVLAGMELDGTKFFYVNPLESLPGISQESQTHPHTLVKRPKWFACACCPPNVARLLPSIADYAWRLESKTLWSNLFIGGTLDLSNELGGKIIVETDYPYGETVRYKFAPSAEKMNMTLAVRVPFWSEKTEIKLCGEKADCEIRDGYAYITRDFNADDVVEVKLDMSPKRIYASTKVAYDNGRTAFSRGPFVYCAEGVDNNGDVLSLVVKKNAVPKAVEKKDKLYGIVELVVDGYRIKATDDLYSLERPQTESCKITLVPYYSWGNRGVNQMRIWLPEQD